MHTLDCLGQYAEGIQKRENLPFVSGTEAVNEIDEMISTDLNDRIWIGDEEDVHFPKMPTV